MLATLTALLLALGVLLAAFGTAGFTLNWQSTPDHDSLRFTQTLAALGRKAAYTALIVHLAGHALPTTPPLLWWTAAALGAATYLTRTSNTVIPATS